MVGCEATILLATHQMQAMREALLMSTLPLQQADRKARMLPLCCLPCHTAAPAPSAKQPALRPDVPAAAPGQACLAAARDPAPPAPQQAGAECRAFGSACGVTCAGRDASSQHMSSLHINQPHLGKQLQHVWRVFGEALEAKPKGLGPRPALNGSRSLLKLVVQLLAGVLPGASRALHRR